MDRSDASNESVGELRFLGGWELVSEDPAFGGISGLVVNGQEFLAIGDAGGVFRFTLDEAGVISNALITMVPDGPSPPGGGEPGKLERDAESITHDPGSGRYWIGFERAHEIWRYTASLDASEADHAPTWMAGWPSNGGAEAMIRRSDGTFMVFSETGQGPHGSTDALYFTADPTAGPDGPEAGEATPVRFGYRPPDGYQITDAAPLSDGRALFLNRRFSVPQGLSAILTIAEVENIEEGQILEGRPIAQLDAPLTVDNMEAVAVVEERGRTIIWLASDDNFHPLQRTLLLRFEWPSPANEIPDDERQDQTAPRP